MEKEKLFCKKCQFIGYDINRSNGQKVPMCNCFPIFRMIQNIYTQPEWCPQKK